MHKVAVLVLAAGESRRMGKPKQLLPWKHTTLLNYTIETVQTVAEKVVVVLGANADLIKPTLTTKVKTITNNNWQEGMGTSIALGVKHLIANDHPEYILVVLADQPLMDALFLNQLIANKNPNAIMATSYADGVGVPVLFPKKYFAQLTRLNKDYGAKKLLKLFHKDVQQFNAGQKVVDLDTPEGYAKYYSAFGK